MAGKPIVNYHYYCMFDNGVGGLITLRGPMMTWMTCMEGMLWKLLGKLLLAATQLTLTLRWRLIVYTRLIAMPSLQH